VISNFIYVGKPRVILVDGPMTLVDENLNLKGVLFFEGLKKISAMCGSQLVANTNPTTPMI
jgi:hypothetical protein